MDKKCSPLDLGLDKEYKPPLFKESLLIRKHLEDTTRHHIQMAFVSACRMKNERLAIYLLESNFFVYINN